MIFLDTNVLVAAAQRGHPRHEPCRSLLEGATETTHCIGAHSLVELYSVTTGMPRPHRLPPEAALTMVQQATETMRVVSLTSEEYFETVQAMADRGLTGGIVYDALLMRCAAKAEADAIYTLNERHFRMIAPDLAERIMEPG